MIDHVSARCDHFRMLFPSRNIESIVPLSEPVAVHPLARRRAGTPTTVDMRRLLGVRASEAPLHGIRLEWVSSDAERRVALLVDSVDEIVNSPHGHLKRLPLLPKRLIQLCDGVLRDPDGTYRLSVRLDVNWPASTFSERRIWRRALVTVDASEVSSALTQAYKLST